MGQLPVGQGAGLSFVPRWDSRTEIQGKRSKNNYQERELERWQVFFLVLEKFSLLRIGEGEKIDLSGLSPRQWLPSWHWKVLEDPYPSEQIQFIWGEWKDH